MKQGFNKVFFIVLGGAWGLCILLNILTPKKQFSENENRFLADMPSFSMETLLNGHYMNKIDEYVNDHLFGREYWISAQSMLEYGIGKRESNGVLIGKNRLMSNVKRPDQQIVEENLQAIQRFAAQQTIPTSFMLVPTASAIYQDCLPLFADTWDQREGIERLYQESRIQCIPVFDVLKQQESQYLYYRTDHHWTTYGAYLAYTELCKAWGLSAAPYRVKQVSQQFNGTLYSKSGVRFMQSDSIDAFQTPYAKGCSVYTGKEWVSHEYIYFEEFLSKKDKYAYFLGSNQPVVILHGTAGTGRKLLVFKDSYAHCFAPLLLENFDEITLVDLRYINGKIEDVLPAGDNNAILFLYNMDTFTSDRSIAKISE